MKNLIIYLILILFTNTKQDPCYDVEPDLPVPYYVIAEFPMGQKLKIPNHLLQIDTLKFNKWWCEGRFNSIEEYVEGSAQTIVHKIK
tara:strand:- start:4553 stop:4813 length:261 start_codon:yes stop_codon:yes gene_type:complete